MIIPQSNPLTRIYQGTDRPSRNTVPKPDCREPTSAQPLTGHPGRSSHPSERPDYAHRSNLVTLADQLRPDRGVHNPQLGLQVLCAAAHNTYLPIADGSNLYLATVIDCFSRRLAGWAIAEHMRTDLVADALTAAHGTRGSLAGAIFHSDQGAQLRFKGSSQHCCLRGTR